MKKAVLLIPIILIIGTWLFLEIKKSPESQPIVENVADVPEETLGAGSAPVLDAVSSSTSASGGSVTFSHTVTASESDLVLIVCAETGDGDADPTGVTYNAVSMTKAVSVGESSVVNSSLWYLIDPDTGANNVVITYGGNLGVSGAALSYYDAHQTTPIGDTASSSTPNGTSIGTTLTSTDLNSVLIDCFYQRFGATNVAPGGSQTERFRGTAGGGSSRFAGSTRSAATIGDYDMDWTWSAGGANVAAQTSLELIGSTADVSAAPSQESDLILFE